MSPIGDIELNFFDQFLLLFYQFNQIITTAPVIVGLGVPFTDILRCTDAINLPRQSQHTSR